MQLKDIKIKNADFPKLEKGGSENRRPEGGGDGKDARATVYPPELLA